MDIFMRPSDDVADQDTVYLPVAVQRSQLEPDTQVDVTAVLFIPSRNTPREICAVPAVPLPSVHSESPPDAAGTFQVLCQQDAIMDIASTNAYLYSMQTLRPTTNLLDSLITIEHLCKLFLLQRGSLPLEISLHWLLCLELMAYGHSSFCYALTSDLTVQSANKIVRIPFVTSHAGSENMIVVRGK
ncbi:hypothetical protein [Dictyobacter kobayashii]|uniref:Uncharacterized protein n=1 Tax=Dictyobacter kobayashii TaxID=2014872 RepID=A0A402AXP0_9CHLR|nr:hypothetical protein [Dictyobacter kobayashii]GCE23839.1 hypothetical protein KDK_76390 [Dictyobacter kobayashii]